MLSLLGEAVHGLDDFSACMGIGSLNSPDTNLVTVMHFVIVAAMVVALPTGDLFTQLTDFPCFVVVVAHLSPVEEERCMDMWKPLSSPCSTQQM